MHFKTSEIKSSFEENNWIRRKSIVLIVMRIISGVERWSDADLELSGVDFLLVPCYYSQLICFASLPTFGKVFYAVLWFVSIYSYAFVKTLTLRNFVFNKGNVKENIFSSYPIETERLAVGGIKMQKVHLHMVRHFEEVGLLGKMNQPFRKIILMNVPFKLHFSEINSNRLVVSFERFSGFHKCEIIGRSSRL